MAKRLAEQQKLRLEGTGFSFFVLPQYKITSMIYFIGRGSGMFGSLKAGDLSSMSITESSPTISAPVIPSGAAFVDIPVTGVRGIIAKRLLESKNTIPHYYLTVHCNVDKIMQLRAKFNKELEKEGVKLSVNDFVIKAAATACKKVPEVNSAWLGDKIRQYVIAFR